MIPVEFVKSLMAGLTPSGFSGAAEQMTKDVEVEHPEMDAPSNEVDDDVVAVEESADEEPNYSFLDELDAMLDNHVEMEVAPLVWVFVADTNIYMHFLNIIDDILKTGKLIV